MPVLRPSGSDFTSFVKAAAQYVPAGRAGKPSKSGGVPVALPGLGAFVRASQVGALASPTTSAVVINGITPPPAGGGPPPAFSPAGITGLALWLDAADPLGTGTPPTNGAAVPTWVDKSGNGRNGTGFNGPTYSSSGIVFNGINTYFTTTYTAAPTAETVFVIQKRTVQQTGDLLGHPSTNGTREFYISGADELAFINKGVAVLGVVSIFPINNVTQLVGYTYTTSSASFYQNGTNVLTTTFSNTFSATGTQTSIGGNGRGPMAGTISEIVIYNTALNTTQRQTVEGYLAWKWGLQASLPAGHPFKTAAPT
jgi:hypothetical protein